MEPTRSGDNPTPSHYRTSTAVDHQRYDDAPTTSEAPRCEWGAWSQAGVKACQLLATWSHYVHGLEEPSHYCEQHKCPKCVALYPDYIKEGP